MQNHTVTLIKKGQEIKRRHKDNDVSFESATGEVESITKRHRKKKKRHSIGAPLNQLSQHETTPNSSYDDTSSDLLFQTSMTFPTDVTSTN